MIRFLIKNNLNFDKRGKDIDLKEMNIFSFPNPLENNEPELATGVKDIFSVRPEHASINLEVFLQVRFLLCKKSNHIANMKMKFNKWSSLVFHPPI